MRTTSTRAVSLMPLGRLPSGIHLPLTSSHASRIRGRNDAWRSRARWPGNASRIQSEVSS
jgi:hypothetical protein